MPRPPGKSFKASPKGSPATTPETSTSAPQDALQSLLPAQGQPARLGLLSSTFANLAATETGPDQAYHRKVGGKLAELAAQMTPAISPQT